MSFKAMNELAELHAEVAKLRAFYEAQRLELAELRESVEEVQRLLQAITRQSTSRGKAA